MAMLCIGYERGSELDHEYHKNTHVPLIKKHWGGDGVHSWKVMRSADDKGPFEIIAAIQFENNEAYQKAEASVSEEARKEIHDDVKNFSKKPPVVWLMDVVAHS